MADRGRAFVLVSEGTVECAENLPTEFVIVTARELTVLLCSGETGLAICLLSGTLH